MAITSDLLNVTLKGYASFEYPQLAFITTHETISLKENILGQMIHQTLFAVAETEYIQVINGLLFQLSEGHFTMAASDSYRFALINQVIKNDQDVKRRCVVPGSSVKELKKLIDLNSQATAEIALGQNQIQFILGKTTVITRLLQGDYINFDSIMPETYTTTVTLNTQPFIDALEISSVFADKLNSAVRVHIKDSQLEVTANSEMGTISKLIPAKVCGHQFETAFNIKYLLEGLKATTEAIITLSFVNGGRMPMVMHAPNNHHYQYLLSPVLVAGIN